VFNFALLKEKNLCFYGAKSCENEIYSQSIVPFFFGLYMWIWILRRIVEDNIKGSFFYSFGFLIFS
jgi:hypothetical protein